MQYICKECNLEFKSLWGLSSHSVQKHKLKPEDLYVKYELNDNKPTCACGCGETPKFLGIKKGFREFIRGHSSSVHNNWGHNPKANKKSHETQKKMYQNGELTIWNKGLDITDERVKKGTEKMLRNTERSEKISKALLGKKRPKEVLDKLNKGMLEYWAKEENREKRKLDMSVYIQKHQYNNKTLLELKFEDLLKSLNIDFISQYTMCGYNFDYYVPKNNIIIEVDGDFWHCNPKKFPNGPIYKSQYITIKNDKKKDLICENTKNIILLRFWESDINQNPQMIIDKLIEYIQPVSHT